MGFDFALECRQVEGNTTAGSISGSPILTRNNCLSATRSLRLTSRPMFIWIIARECLGSSCSSTQRLHSPDCVALSRRSGGMLGWAGAEERCDEGTQQRVRCWALRSNRWLAVFTEPRLRCSFLQPHHPPRRLPRLRYVVFWASSLTGVPWSNNTRTYAGAKALRAACSSTARTCSMVTPGNHSTNCDASAPSSRFSKRAATGTRVPRNTQAPLTRSGSRSTAGQVGQSIMVTCYHWARKDCQLEVDLMINICNAGKRFL